MSHRPMEYAMTHRVGASGVREVYQRPTEVREMAARLQKWGVVPESCQSCLARAAVRVCGGMALCGSCREQRYMRLSLPMETHRLATRVEPPDEEATGLQLRGLAIVFNSRSEDMGFFEYIRPSAVDRTIQEGIDVRALWSHNTDIVLGRVSAGTLRLRKVTRGLAVEVDPPRWAVGHVETVKRRDVVGQSFGFQVLEDEWWLEDGYPHREILDMQVFETSAVAFPAYPATTLRVAKSDERSAWLREQETAERLRLAR